MEFYAAGSGYETGGERAIPQTLQQLGDKKAPLEKGGTGDPPLAPLEKGGTGEDRPPTPIAYNKLQKD